MLVEGMQLRICLRAGQPQRDTFPLSRAWMGCFPGMLAIKAPRTSLKSYCSNCEIRVWSLLAP